MARNEQMEKPAAEVGMTNVLALFSKLTCSPIVETPEQLAVRQLPAVTIKTLEQETEAREFRDKVKTALKEMTAEKKLVRAPKKKELDVIDQHYQLRLDLLGVLDAALSRAILAWMDFQEKEAARKQALADKAYDNKVDKAVKKAEETGTALPIIAPPPQISGPAKTVTLESGAKQTRQDCWKWKVLDTPQGKDPEVFKEEVTAKDLLPHDAIWPLAIPAEHWVLKKATITAITKAGSEVPGTHRYNDPILV